MPGGLPEVNLLLTYFLLHMGSGGGHGRDVMVWQGHELVGPTGNTTVNLRETMISGVGGTGHGLFLEFPIIILNFKA
jgi:hypothetical protein